jgi:hypothetical protein
MVEIKSMQKPPEGPSGFEPLKISSLRLCRRSLTAEFDCNKAMLAKNLRERYPVMFL